MPQRIPAIDFRDLKSYFYRKNQVAMEDRSNAIVRKQMLKVVNRQLRMNDPPATRATFERLRAGGYSASDAKALIARCVASEIFAVLSSREPFNQSRFVKELEKLPGGGTKE